MSVEPNLRQCKPRTQNCQNQPGPDAPPGYGRDPLGSIGLQDSNASQHHVEGNPGGRKFPRETEQAVAQHRSKATKQGSPK